MATNGATDIQEAKLCATGIADRVDAVCISEEVGARKPDPAVFREAVRRCGAALGGIDGWMVGDNPMKDIEGGRVTGLRTVWVDHAGAWPKDLREPDHRVPDIRSAMDVLVGLHSSRIPV
ncbi:HAD family hydrolase [Streptomyces sp. 8N706]|uniref:HAD family hydrolase n=1 Tax=Streptomyces sp. 8N706 TaxID=3457416 RepID=UPI003FD370B2